MKLWSNNNVQKGNGGINPERRLLAAILQRAITDYLTGDGDLQASAEEWLYSEEDEKETFGFAYICEALDFHKEELRKAVGAQHRRIMEKKLQRNKASTAKYQPQPNASHELGRSFIFLERLSNFLTLPPIIILNRT